MSFLLHFTHEDMFDFTLKIRQSILIFLLRIRRKMRILDIFFQVFLHGFLPDMKKAKTLRLRWEVWFFYM